MAEVDVAKVLIRHELNLKGERTGRWFAASYGANGEAIAWTEAYEDVRDAEAAALTIAAGATISRED